MFVPKEGHDKEEDESNKASSVLTKCSSESKDVTRKKTRVTRRALPTQVFVPRQRRGKEEDESNKASSSHPSVRPKAGK